MGEGGLYRNGRLGIGRCSRSRTWSGIVAAQVSKKIRSSYVLLAEAIDADDCYSFDLILNLPNHPSRPGPGQL